MSSSSVTLVDSDPRHPPIDRQRDQIRLIRLHPGTLDDPVAIDVFVQDLSNARPYMALSYAWGTGQSPPITVNGIRTIIRSNLERALRRIREKSSFCVLWVDAICINQDSTDERNHQVGLMGRIYSSAHQVIVWLGDMAAMEYEGYALRALRQSGLALSHLMQTDLRLRLGVLQLCLRDWFSRIWVVQEVALAKRDPRVRCGPFEISWAVLLESLLLLRNFIEPEITAAEFPYAKFAESWRDIIRNVLARPQLSHVWLGVPAVRELWAFFDKNGHLLVPEGGDDPVGLMFDQTFQRFRTCVRDQMYALDYFLTPIIRFEGIRRMRLDLSLGQKMALTRELESTDPRDKIYGLLGIANFPNSPIMADYSLPVERLYTEAAVQIIIYRFECGYPEFPLVPASVRIKSWPSWVPNFSPSTQKDRGNPRCLCPAEGGLAELLQDLGHNLSQFVSFSPDMTAMKVLGQRLDTIALYVPIDCTNVEDVPGELRRLQRAFPEADPELILDAIMGADNTFNRKDERSRSVFVQTFRTLCASLQDPRFQPDEETYGSICETISDTRQPEAYVFITDSGLLGLCPAVGIKAGDLVAGLFGLGFPMILRQEEQTTMVCAAHIGGRRYGHEFVKETKDPEMLTEKHGMEWFEIH